MSELRNRSFARNSFTLTRKDNRAFLSCTVGQVMIFGGCTTDNGTLNDLCTIDVNDLSIKLVRKIILFELWYDPFLTKSQTKVTKTLANQDVGLGSRNFHAKIYPELCLQVKIVNKEDKICIFLNQSAVINTIWNISI